MQQKYKIQPGSQSKFQALLNSFPCNREHKQKLKEVKILHVEVDVPENSWEILLQSYKPFHQVFLDDLGQHVAQQCQLKQVSIYQHIANLADGLQSNWPNIIRNAANYHPLMEEILQATSPIVDGNIITLKIPTVVEEKFLQIPNGEKIIQQSIAPLITVDFHLHCQITKKTTSREEELLALQKQILASRPKTSSKAEPSNGDDKKPYKRREPKQILTDSVLGTPTKLDTVDGEYKSIILAGTIANLDTRVFKNGNTLVSFDFADRTQGIICKIFAKPEELEKLLPALKGADSVIMEGRVAHDIYLNDYTFLPNKIQVCHHQLRKDTAREKRVELHAHTKMSNMDAVVEPKDLIARAAKWGWPAIAITDHGVVQAFPKAMDALAKIRKAENSNIKVIYGVEGYVTGPNYQQPRANHIIILAKNVVGLHNLYRLVSISHLKYLFKSRPRLPRHIIQEYREGLIIGSACEAGELIRAIVQEEPEEKLREIAEFYDYLEIQPIGNNAFLKRSSNFPNINTDEDLIKINLKVAELAKALNKPLVATCDVHFLNEQDSIYRAILMNGKGFDDAELQPPLYLRTTDEMLEEFKYLGEELAYEAVVTNPRAIADMVEDIQPIPDEEKLYSPAIPGAEKAIHDMAYAKAISLYGDPLPELVKERLDMELNSIIGHGFAVLYLIAHKLVGKSLDDGYLVGSRGSVGSSLVATMTDITEVNPLPPHWRCPKCQHSQFITDGSYNCGYDMPDKNCPHCETKMVKDGHDVPFAVFMGFDGDKVPDIDLNFSGVYQPTVHKYTEVLFGKNNVFRAGTISSVADKTAYAYIKNFFESKGQRKRNAYINSFIKGCKDVKRTTGQHPGGIMVVPRDMDVHHFTPVQRPADDKTADTITTHFDYHSISSRLVKLDLLGHDDPTVIKMLENLIGIDARSIPFDDEKTMSIFSSTDALGVTPEELGATSGTFGIPEFRTPFTRQMLDDTQPKKFSDLVRISGFSHGTDVWLNNAQDLIRQGICTVSESISCRDDIMMYLIHSGMEPLFAFKTMEKVRKGKGLTDDDVAKMQENNIPDWFIESCKKIKYLFPRAHAIAYVMMAFRIAYCKVHYPLAFYAAYFSIRAAEFDAQIIAQGKDVVRKKLDELNNLKNEKELSVKDKNFQIILELAWEMYLRGFQLQKVDLYRSPADKFQIEGDSLLPPFTALAGVSVAAANNIVRAREEYDFTSISDLQKRASLTTPVVEALRQHGCLADLPETDQLSLF